MHRRHLTDALAVLALVAASPGLACSSSSSSEPWAAPAEEFVAAWFEARSEGISNELQFYVPNVVWEDRTGNHLFTDRDAFIDYAVSILGQMDPGVHRYTFLSADDAMIAYSWPDWDPPVDQLARIRVGSGGIEHLSNTASTYAGRVYRPGVRDFDAIDETVRRWVSFWNDHDRAAAALYSPQATIEDTLFGRSVVGVDAIDDAARARTWPASAPLALEPTPDGTAEWITVGLALRPEDVDQIGMIVRVDDPTCPHLDAVHLGWDGERIVWERRFHELQATRSCGPTDDAEPGWWLGVEVPEPVARVFTGVVQLPSTGLSVSMYNSSDALDQVVVEQLDAFVDAGLEPPPVEEFAFLQYRTKCTNWDGFTTDRATGVVVSICLTEDEICSGERCSSVDESARLVILHELAHAWLYGHADAELQEAFVDFVGVESWNDLNDPWRDRGIERAASAIAVGLAGDLGPDGCTDGRYSDVTPGSFELLTGVAPPG